MRLADGWKDYAVIDCGGGEKLERWGDIILRRPDPQAIWPKAAPEKWNRADGFYHRSDRGGGEWEFMRRLPEHWEISYGALRFRVRPTNFKHTGLFPEQAANWDEMTRLIKNAGRPISVLNMFAYTGGASLACLAAGASVCHVDAAKGMVAWAKENAELSGIADRPIRYIIDDCMAFVKREERRGHKYDAILMDPPSYGRGPSKEIWKIEDALYPLVEESVKLLSENPLFFLINSYTTGLQPAVLKNILDMAAGAGRGGKTFADELGLPVQSGLVLPCGASGWWINE